MKKTFILLLFVFSLNTQASWEAIGYMLQGTAGIAQLAAEADQSLTNEKEEKETPQEIDEINCCCCCN